MILPQHIEGETMIALAGTLTKLRAGQRAGFNGRIGSFFVEHPSLGDLTLGVHEARIVVTGLTKKKGEVLMALASAPVIGKCVFVKPT